MDHSVGERMGINYLLGTAKMKMKNMPKHPHSNNPTARDASMYVVRESIKLLCKGWQYASKGLIVTSWESGDLSQSHFFQHQLLVALS